MMSHEPVARERMAAGLELTDRAAALAAGLEVTGLATGMGLVKRAAGMVAEGEEDNRAGLTA
jgi:hypothetical protein